MSRSRTLTCIVVLLLATIPATAGATVIDSFTDALPSHPLMTASGRQVVFLGWACDGAACPPASNVQQIYNWDGAEQTGLPGVYGGAYRHVIISSVTDGYPYLDGDWMLRIDPAAGGRLILAPYGGDIYLQVEWGRRPNGGLNLDLVADGTDHFEIDVLSAPAGSFGHLQLYSLNASGGIDGSTERFFTVDGPGVVSLPYASIPGLAAFDDDVDMMSFSMFGEQVANNDVVIGEFRTASTAVPADASTWGRVKAAYRR